MKQWWQTVAKDYFAFSKKEGIAILTIAIIALCLWLFTHYFPSQNSVPKGKETFQNELANNPQIKFIRVRLRNKPSSRLHRDFASGYVPG